MHIINYGKWVAALFVFLSVCYAAQDAMSLDQYQHAKTSAGVPTQQNINPLETAKRAAKKVTKKYQQQQSRINNLLQQTAEHDGVTWYLLLLAFLAGVFVSFTPCVYPMIPITVGILQSQASRSVVRNFFASLFYVLGICIVYSTLGYVSATAGVLFGQWVSNTWIILFSVLFFLYFAFSMFGFYEMYMPRFLQHRDHSPGGKSLFNIFIYGLISGTVASPCLTPALAVLLALVAKIGSPIAGFAVLFIFSLGMGLLLLIIGTLSNSVAALPRVGEWILDIKRLMGFMLLAACVYFLQPLLGRFFGAQEGFVSLTLYAAVGVATGIYFITQRMRSTLLFVIGILLILFALGVLSTFWYVQIM